MELPASEGAREPSDEEELLGTKMSEAVSSFEVGDDSDTWF